MAVTIILRFSFLKVDVEVEVEEGNSKEFFFFKKKHQIILASRSLSTMLNDVCFVIKSPMKAKDSSDDLMLSKIRGNPFFKIEFNCRCRTSSSWIIRFYHQLGVESSNSSSYRFNLIPSLNLG